MARRIVEGWSESWIRGWRGEEVRSDEKCTINYKRDIRDIKSTDISL